MEKFNSIELKIFNLILAGKSRSQILAKKITTAAMMQNALCGIYAKTEDIVKFKTARNKFDELACFVRNNPDAFNSFLEVEEAEEVVAAEVEEVKLESLKGSTGPADSETATSKVMKVIDRISTKLQTKLEILDEVKIEIEKELDNE